MNELKVSDIVGKINKIADPGLAMAWDNVGLQIGLPENDVHRILLTLDVTEKAVEFAIANKVDLIVSHHPLIFRSLKKITNQLFITLIKNDIAVYCAHTNLDVVKNGVNSALADRVEIKNRRVLSAESGSDLFQVAVYVPQDSMDQLAEGILHQGAGIIGNYSDCLNDFEVSGQFRPELGSDPAIGELNKLEKVIERKLEVFVDSFNLNKVLDVINKLHPYETPVYTVTKQERKSDNYGLGLVGELEQEMPLNEFAEKVKEKLNAPFVKLWTAGKEVSTKVKTIAVCGGSGSSLIGKALSEADVYISADFTYHTVLESRIPLIDAGHFYTEFPVMQNLKKILSCFDLEIMTLPIDKHEINNQIII